MLRWRAGPRQEAGWTQLRMRARLLRRLQPASGWLALLVFALVLAGTTPGGDALVYYSVDAKAPYRASSVLTASFNYTPAFAQVLHVAQRLPFDAFHLLILALELGALAYLAGPSLAALLVAVQAPLIWQDLVAANLYLSAGAAAMAGMRFPALWAFPLLTKVTPGVGLLWFAARADWRSLGIAVGATCAIALMSFIAAPHLWGQWLMLSSTNATSLNSDALLFRWATAAGLVVWGARTDRLWTIPLAVAVAYPVSWYGWVVMLVLVRWSGVLAHRGWQRHQIRP